MILTPAVRKELEAFGAQFTHHPDGYESVHVPGADATWHFDPGVPHVSFTPAERMRPGQRDILMGRARSIASAMGSSNPALAALHIGMGGTHAQVGPWHIHLVQYLQRLNGIKPVRQPYVLLHHEDDRSGTPWKGGYVDPRDHDIWNSALGHLAGEAPLESVVDAMIAKHGEHKPTKLASIGGPTAIVRVPVPQPVAAPTPPAAPPAPPKPRAPVWILPQ